MIDLIIVCAAAIFIALLYKGQLDKNRILELELRKARKALKDAIVLLNIEVRGQTKAIPFPAKDIQPIILYDNTCESPDGWDRCF